MKIDRLIIALKLMETAAKEVDHARVRTQQSKEITGHVSASSYQDLYAAEETFAELFAAAVKEALR